MLNKNQKLGEWGEEIVKKYLIKKGYKILNSNYKNYFGEIDIIAKLKSKIIFIEVKTRTNRKFGLPEEAVNFIKQKKLIRTAEKYIIDNRIKDEYQIDVAAVEMRDNEKIKLRHFKNAVRYF